MRMSAVSMHEASDRKVLFAGLTVAVVAAGMLPIYALERMGTFTGHQELLTAIESTSALIIFGVTAFAAPLALREMRRRHKATEGALEAQEQVEQLFKMTDMLQSALDYSDANAVLRSTAAQLLPALGGALYIFNNSGDRLELSTVWNWSDDAQPADLISPSQCWALKRGKTHLNYASAASLLCEHHAQSSLVLEIPMMARGEVFGLLLLQDCRETANASLAAATQVACALSDAMSLALSNIALRDKLRIQALHDPLTGLHNRRYMEDILRRYANLAERNETPFSVIMIDLDHFKHLNDQFGHALGDIVLADVASVIIGSIRPCDVACRYGGEELVVLIPDCGPTEVLAKAELLRVKIERLSDDHGTPISASLGVATWPDTSSRITNLITDADAALYCAKADGRNCVVAAEVRASRTVSKRTTLSEAA